ncbi:MAG TPA: phosphoribosyltransferase family protein [Candidatus Saccharimonadales bacterium]|nr:phosphoribosyltransferase family protein [Candidatus Saccharimonadales bacterium]
MQTCSPITDGFCIVCELSSINGDTHPWCSKTTTPKTVFSSFAYEDTVRKCIRTAKYGSKQFAALKKLAYEGVTFASKCRKDLDWKDAVVVPIPLSKNRYKDRGFNQVEYIAVELCRQFNLKLDTSILKRAKETQVQFEHNRVERFKNLANAFISDQKRVENQKILLVDDICTSGATLLEGCKCLYNSNCSEVHCFTLARRPLYSNASQLGHQVI